MWFEQIITNDNSLIEDPDLAIDPIPTYRYGNYHQTSVNFSKQFDYFDYNLANSKNFLSTSRYHKADNFLFFNLNIEFFYNLSVNNSINILALTNLEHSIIQSRIKNPSSIIEIEASTSDGPDYPCVKSFVNNLQPEFFTITDITQLDYYIDDSQSKITRTRLSYITNQNATMTQWKLQPNISDLTCYQTSTLVKAGFYNTINIAEAQSTEANFVFIEKKYFEPFIPNSLIPFTIDDTDLDNPNNHVIDTPDYAVTNIQQYLGFYNNEHIFKGMVNNILIIAGANFEYWRVALIPIAGFTNLLRLEIINIDNIFYIVYVKYNGILVLKTTDFYVFDTIENNSIIMGSFWWNYRNFQDETGAFYFVGFVDATNNQSILYKTTNFIDLTVIHTYNQYEPTPDFIFNGRFYWLNFTETDTYYNEYYTASYVLTNIISSPNANKTDPAAITITPQYAGIYSNNSNKFIGSLDIKSYFYRGYLLFIVNTTVYQIKPDALNVVRSYGNLFAQNFNVVNLDQTYCELVGNFIICYVADFHHWYQQTDYFLSINSLVLNNTTGYFDTNITSTNWFDINTQHFKWREDPARICYNNTEYTFVGPKLGEYKNWFEYKETISSTNVPIVAPNILFSVYPNKRNYLYYTPNTSLILDFTIAATNPNGIGFLPLSAIHFKPGNLGTTVAQIDNGDGTYKFTVDYAIGNSPVTLQPTVSVTDALSTSRTVLGPAIIVSIGTAGSYVVSGDLIPTNYVADNSSAIPTIVTNSPIVPDISGSINSTSTINTRTTTIEVYIDGKIVQATITWI